MLYQVVPHGVAALRGEHARTLLTLVHDVTVQLGVFRHLSQRRLELRAQRALERRPTQPPVVTLWGHTQIFF